MENTENQKIALVYGVAAESTSVEIEARLQKRGYAIETFQDAGLLNARMRELSGNPSAIVVAGYREGDINTSPETSLNVATDKDGAARYGEGYVPQNNLGTVLRCAKEWRMPTLVYAKNKYLGDGSLLALAQANADIGIFNTQDPKEVFDMRLAATINRTSRQERGLTANTMEEMLSRREWSEAVLAKSSGRTRQ